MNQELKDVLGSFAFTFMGVTIGAAVVMILLLVIEGYVVKSTKPTVLRTLAVIAGAVTAVFLVLAVVFANAVTSAS